MASSLVLTVEHGGHRVPGPWQHMFTGMSELLRSHRGFDAGALALARELSRDLHVPLFASDVTRLLIDPNRSPNHRQLFSQITRSLPAPERKRILECVYQPHRDRIQNHIDGRVTGGFGVVHISVHSFVPILDGNVRNLDVGLLYDPSHAAEKSFCSVWKKALTSQDLMLRVRFNRPYLGKADGLTTWFRHRLDPSDYIGVELEVNQRLLDSRQTRFRPSLTRAIRHSLAESWREWTRI